MPTHPYELQGPGGSFSCGFVGLAGVLGERPRLSLLHSLFLTTFTPSFHHTECPDEDGFLPPILDTGATHVLLPLRWMTNEQAGSSKIDHLHVPSGSKVRALLHDNIITAQLSLVLCPFLSRRSRPCKMTEEQLEALEARLAARRQRLHA